jgi:hypothetical protein
MDTKEKKELGRIEEAQPTRPPLQNFPDFLIRLFLGSPYRRDTATSTRDACATQIRVHSCQFVVKVR